MNKLSHRIPTILTAALLCQPGVARLLATDKAKLQDEKAKVSYTLGVNYGRYLKNSDIELDMESFNAAIKDVLAGTPLPMTDVEFRQVETDFRKKLQAKREEKRKLQGDKNRKESAEFLAANKTKEGVKTFPSGLQYKILTEGTGPVPKTNELVKANYRGSFIDGKEFDSTANRGPFETTMQGVIPGWTEALSHMKVGSKWQLFIPPELAYGETGRGNIPPNSTLIFELELLGVRSQPEAPAVTSDIVKVPSAEELKKGAKIEVLKPEDVQKIQRQTAPPLPAPAAKPEAK